MQTSAPSPLGPRLAAACANAPWRRWWRAALSLALPTVCAGCGEATDDETRALCLACRLGWVPLPHPRCTRCGHPRRTHACQWCERLPPYVRAARSVAWYPDGTARQVMAALKYAGWRGVADELARAMAHAHWPEDVRAERAAYVPVPLARSRELARGFNQSAVLAHALAAHDPLPVWSDVLARTRQTTSQTRLTPSERLRNVSAAFGVSVGARSRLRGRHIVLVDDVITTAATLNACAVALLEGGARVVSYLSFGRARAPGDEPPPERPRR